ncbi:MAG: hypothetical protein V7K68_21900 [Nostoc sp.]|uniref:hypothetical protein n=1 Tax=Nostoc sp. TaxID=1180 RepID=UPI002FF9E0C9
MSTISAIEDFISFRGHQVWYRIVKPDREDSGKLPLLCLHGGPGVPHDYLERTIRSDHHNRTQGDFLRSIRMWK